MFLSLVDQQHSSQWREQVVWFLGGPVIVSLAQARSITRWRRKLECYPCHLSIAYIDYAHFFYCCVLHSGGSKRLECVLTENIPAVVAGKQQEEEENLTEVYVLPSSLRTAVLSMAKTLKLSVRLSVSVCLIQIPYCCVAETGNLLVRTSDVTQ